MSYVNLDVFRLFCGFLGYFSNFVDNFRFLLGFARKPSQIIFSYQWITVLTS